MPSRPDPGMMDSVWAFSRHSNPKLPAYSRGDMTRGRFHMIGIRSSGRFGTKDASTKKSPHTPGLLGALFDNSGNQMKWLYH